MSRDERVLNLKGANLTRYNQGKPNKVYPSGRVCARIKCAVILSIYNEDEFCWDHTPGRTFAPDPELSARAKRIHARRYDKNDYTHGTYFAYCFRGCRCEPCTKAHAYVLKTRDMAREERRKR